MATTTELFAEALHIAWMNWAKGLIEYVPQTKRDKWTKGMVPFAELPEEYKSQECDYARKVLTAMGMNETLEKAAAYASLTRQLSDSEKEVETERMRLAGCGVAAMQNTESTIKDRITPDNPYYSASYGDVCGAVDREMRLRSDLAEAYGAIWRKVYLEEHFSPELMKTVLAHFEAKERSAGR